MVKSLTSVCPIKLIIFALRNISEFLYIITTKHEVRIVKFEYKGNDLTCLFEKYIWKTC